MRRSCRGKLTSAHCLLGLVRPGIFFARLATINIFRMARPMTNSLNFRRAARGVAKCDLVVDEFRSQRISRASAHNRPYNLTQPHRGSVRPYLRPGRPHPFVLYRAAFLPQFSISTRVTHWRVAVERSKSPDDFIRRTFTQPVTRGVELVLTLISSGFTGRWAYSHRHAVYDARFMECHGSLCNPIDNRGRPMEGPRLGSASSCSFLPSTLFLAAILILASRACLLGVVVVWAAAKDLLGDGLADASSCFATS